MAKKIIIKLIEFYQKTLSPDSGYISRFFPGGYCKFTPNCSQYCKEAVGKHGVVKGLVMGTGRILRCNPWSRGGWDPVK